MWACVIHTLSLAVQQSTLRVRGQSAICELIRSRSLTAGGGSIHNEVALARGPWVALRI
jgi:hypothetical protein